MPGKKYFFQKFSCRSGLSSGRGWSWLAAAAPTEAFQFTCWSCLITLTCQVAAAARKADACHRRETHAAAAARCAAKAWTSNRAIQDRIKWFFNGKTIWVGPGSRQTKPLVSCQACGKTQNVSFCSTQGSQEKQTTGSSCEMCPNRMFDWKSAPAASLTRNKMFLLRKRETCKPHVHFIK